MTDEVFDLSDIAEPPAPRAGRRRGNRGDISDPFDTIEYYESGGRNIHQQAVPAGGGFNPSVGRVTGPSTASGHYQITNSTWRKNAAKAGVDLKQYPTAMSAPKETQRAVAEKLFESRGFADWAPYNAALRAALKRGEGQGGVRKPPASTQQFDLADIAESAGATPPAAPRAPQQPTQRQAGLAANRRPRPRTPPNQFPKGVTKGVATSRDPSLVGGRPQPRMFGLPQNLSEPYQVGSTSRAIRKAEDALLYDPQLVGASVAEAKGQPVEPAVKQRLQQARRVKEGYDRTDWEANAPNVYTDSGMPAGLRAVLQPIEAGAASITAKAAGAGRVMSRTSADAERSKAAKVLGRLAQSVSPALAAAIDWGGSAPLDAAADYLERKAGDMQSEVAAADAREPLPGPVGFGQRVAGGFIGTAPEMLASAAAPALAPEIFAAGSALETLGTNRNASESEILQAAAPAAVMGNLFEIAPLVPGVRGMGPVMQRAAKGGLVAAGTYPAERYLGGASPGEAAEAALVGGGFAALHASRAPERARTATEAAGQPIAPEVRTAAESAFDRVGIAPEARAKAFADPRIEMQAAVEAAEAQRPAPSTNPRVVPPAGVADYWKVQLPDGRIEGFHTRQEAEHRAAELVGELPTGKYPAVPPSWQPGVVKPETREALMADLQQQVRRGTPLPKTEEGLSASKTAKRALDMASTPESRSKAGKEIVEQLRKDLADETPLTDSEKAELDRLPRLKTDRWGGQEGFARLLAPFDSTGEPVKQYGKSGATADLAEFNAEARQRKAEQPEVADIKHKLNLLRERGMLEDTPAERIENTALRFIGSPPEIGRGNESHSTIRARLGLRPADGEAGFITNIGRFVDRAEAYKIARAAGQVREKAQGSTFWQLLSEDFVPDAPARAGEPHPSTTQRRAPTGTFEAGPPDYTKLKTELLEGGRRIQADYGAIANHRARREGLRTASHLAVRDYFTKLHRFVATNAPEKLELVEQAEAAEMQGDPVRATVLAERALTGTHDFANKVNNAVLATDLLARGIEPPATAPWRQVLSEMRQRFKNEEGSVKLTPPIKPGPEGVKTGAVADTEQPKQRKRSLPKHLERTEREPGTDLTYEVIPNKEAMAAARKRVAEQGIGEAEKWFADAAPSAERTSVFVELADQHLAQLAKASDPAAVKQLAAKAREISNIEAPRSTELGQAVQAYRQLDKYSGPEVLLEATKLADKAGQQLPDNIVQDIAKTGQRFKQADTELKTIRAQIEVAEKPVRGETPAQRATRAHRIERLRDQQAVAVKERARAKVRQEGHLAALQESPSWADYLVRANNIVRGLMVSAIPTAVRNAETQGMRFGVERMVDVFAHTLRRATAQDPHITLRGIHRDAMRLFQKESRTQAIDIASEYPRELRRLFNNYGGGGVDAPKAVGAFATKVDRAFGSVERFVQAANFANTTQEFHIRGAEFLAHLDMLIEREHGMPLERFLRERGADKISKEAIADSVDHALEVTFADLPAADTRFGKAMRSVIDLANIVPPTLSPIPFPRWFYNSWKFTYEFSPAGLVDLARTPRQLREARRALVRIERRPPAKTEATAARRIADIADARKRVERLEETAQIERYRTVGKAVLGTAMFATAYAARAKDGGEKWYELYIPGTETAIDARPFAPFSTYLFLAEGLRRSVKGEKQFTYNEVLQAIGTSTATTGTAKTIYDKMTNGDWDGIFRFLATEGGDLGRAILTPVRQIRDVIGQFDASQATVYDTSTQPLLGPIKTSLPYGERIGEDVPAAQRPTSDKPISDPAPLSKFAGPRIIPPKNFVEHELDRLKFEFREIRPASGVPEADQLEEKWMGEFIAGESANLQADPAYKAATDAAKAELYLKPLLKQGRDQARQRLATERPDLAEKLQNKRKSTRQKALEAEQGISRALELGVPMAIPPRGANEDDIAYRARLLQLGRARRAKLEEAASASDFSTMTKGRQRSLLHRAVYS